MDLVHSRFRNSGPDMAGPIERRGEMFQSRSFLSDTDDEYDNDLEDEDEYEDDRSDVEMTIALSKPSKAPDYFISFAHWAFWAEGIPSLQVFAYGDFSFKSRFDDHNFILCRKEWKVWEDLGSNDYNGEL